MAGMGAQSALIFSGLVMTSYASGSGAGHCDELSIPSTTKEGWITCYYDSVGSCEGDTWNCGYDADGGDVTISCDGVHKDCLKVKPPKIEIA